MTPLKIKYELAKRGISQRSLAKKLEVSETMVSEVIRGFRVSDRVMRAIADAIEQDHRIVFPSYYINGKRRSVS
ncbi:helix-turn-helix domain-containing protein [Desulfatiglans anilini]|uniref:helix-turn-helix domain-containing protein n=1 Tax=Desulfatiglans anilini TaxID=90728 RepID=UPI00047F9477|nr:helix-turn-helix transcriptional regulator [Desulfatiglans anilini]